MAFPAYFLMFYYKRYRKYAIIISSLLISLSFFLSFPYTELGLIITSFGIYAFHYSICEFRYYIYGSSVITHSNLISSTSIGICVIALMFYFQMCEGLFFGLGMLSLSSSVISIILIFFTHEHPSLLYELEEVDGTLQVTSYQLRQQISKSIKNSKDSGPRSQLIKI